MQESSLDKKKKILDLKDLELNAINVIIVKLELFHGNSRILPPVVMHSYLGPDGRPIIWTPL